MADLSGRSAIMYGCIDVTGHFTVAAFSPASCTASSSVRALRNLTFQG
jgi:hypothetical protein